MEQTPLKVQIILGSTRPNRMSALVAPWLLSVVQQYKEFEVEVIDLIDWPMPLYDQAATPSSVVDGNYGNEMVRNFAHKIAQADAYIIIAPEYNHGYSAVLKNAFDSLYAEWNNKPVAYVAYGSVGGARAVEQLRQVAIELQMAPIRQAVHIQAPWSMREESGALKEGALDGYTQAAQRMLEQLAWWASALRSARQG